MTEELIQAHYLAGVGMVQWVPLLAVIAMACIVGAVATFTAEFKNADPSADGAFAFFGVVFLSAAIGFAAWATNNWVQGNLRQQSPAIYAEQALQTAEAKRLRDIWP